MSKGQSLFGNKILKLLQLVHFKELILSTENHCDGSLWRTLLFTWTWLTWNEFLGLVTGLHRSMGPVFLQAVGSFVSVMYSVMYPPRIVYSSRDLGEILNPDWFVQTTCYVFSSHPFCLGSVYSDNTSFCIHQLKQSIVGKMNMPKGKKKSLKIYSGSLNT